MQGREELLRKLRSIKGSPRRHGKKAIEDAAEALAGTMRNLVPVKSGKVRRSIKVKPGAGGDADLSVMVTAGGRETMVEARKGSGVMFDVALGLEFGTSPHTAGGKFAGAKHPGATAQPFFWPAYRLHRRAAKNRITRALKKGIMEDFRR